MPAAQRSPSRSLNRRSLRWFGPPLVGAIPGGPTTISGAAPQRIRLTIYLDPLIHARTARVEVTQRVNRGGRVHGFQPIDGSSPFSRFGPSLARCPAPGSQAD